MATTPKKAPTPRPEPREPDLTNLRVIEFGLENYMRIEAVVIRPGDASLIEITGKNRQGKTSLLRGLTTLFAGKDAVASKPVRRGQTEARLWTILGKDGKPELTIEEILTLKDADGDEVVDRKLKVTPADGRPYSRPQEVLERLYDPIGFAPFAFSRLKPGEQLEAVKALIPGVDFADMAKRRKGTFDDRTQVGRDLVRARARLEGMRRPSVDDPTEEVDVADLNNRLTEAHEHNQLLDRRKANRQQVEGETARLRALIVTLEADLARAKIGLASAEQKLAEAPALPAAIDTAPIVAAIEGAQATNAKVRAGHEYGEASAAVQALATDQQTLTDAIEAIDQEKLDAIAAAKLPVPGLMLGEDQLLLNDLPFEQASAQERLEAAIRIGMAMKPDLKLIVVEDGGLLDPESLARLEVLAEKHGFLVIVEQVTGGQKAGFTIEEGRLKK